MPSDPSAVFVSSTCYDLIDLRAELEAWLRELGFKPFLSDRPFSDFEIVRDVNSIDACLINLRRCSAFICILSRRYGPKLGGDFGDVSATHLEYRTAREAGIPLHVYARDRLEADHRRWKKARNAGESIPAPGWVEDKNERLFEMLDEHTKLDPTATATNWLKSFRDSVDLKSQIAADLGKQSRRLLLRGLLERSDMPAITLSAVTGPGRETNFRYCNVGGGPAFSPRIRFTDGPWSDILDIPAGREAYHSLTCPEGSAVGRIIEIRYTTRLGDVVSETFECLPTVGPTKRRPVELVDGDA